MSLSDAARGEGVSPERRWWKLTVMLAVGVFAVWAAYWMAAPAMADLTGEKPGTFGDMFGAVNALFAGLAFAAVVATLKLQRDDLLVQQKMLQGQLKEQEEQAKIQAFAALANLKQAILGTDQEIYHGGLPNSELRKMEKRREMLGLVEWDLDMHMLHEGYFEGTSLLVAIAESAKKWRFQMESSEARERMKEILSWVDQRGESPGE